MFFDRVLGIRLEMDSTHEQESMKHENTSVYLDC